MKTLLNVLITCSLCLLFTTGWAAERVTYYHNDLLGSPVAATDKDGNVVWREEYKPFGERQLKQTTSKDNAQWYTGKTHDESMGLSYFGARWYNPNIGRFTGIDPVGVDENNLHSFNRYAYANNNPYKYVDPDGRQADDIFGGFNPYQLTEYSGVGGAPRTFSTLGKFSQKNSKGGGSVTKNKKNFAGNQSRNQRLKDMVNDGKVSSTDRGWIRQEMNEVAAGKKGHLRNPPGKDLAHERGREKAKNYGYEHAHLQNRKDHKSQHKLDNWGRSNKERPVR